MTDHVQTKSEIRALLEAAGLRPRKRFGQSFLIDGNLMRRLVACADIEPEDVVLEVGGGTGGLTELLAQAAGWVVCLEIDRGLYAQLTARLADCPNITLLCADALAGKNRLAGQMVDALRQAKEKCQGRAMLVANLPYKIATPLVGSILLDLPEIRRLCFTVQSEVGDRMTAGPGSRAYGPISVLLQSMCDVQVIAQVPPEAFWPRPKVDSVMLRLDVGALPFPTPIELRSFTSFVRSLFEHRRKTLRAAIRHAVPGNKLDRQSMDLDLSRRPQTLSVEEWIGLFRATVGRREHDD